MNLQYLGEAGDAPGEVGEYFGDAGDICAGAVYIYVSFMKFGKAIARYAQAIRRNDTQV